VLKAMDIEHLVTERPDGCHLFVRPAEAGRAGEQLRLYQRENPRRNTGPWPAIEPRRGLPGALGFALALSLAYTIQSGYLWAIDWTSTGELIAGRVTGGEWWRAVTALTLHGDAAHVTGNVVFGSFFGYLAGQYLGSGVAWLAIVWMAAVGNGANALIQDGGIRRARHRRGIRLGPLAAVHARLGAAVGARRRRCCAARLHGYRGRADGYRGAPDGLPGRCGRRHGLVLDRRPRAAASGPPDCVRRRGVADHHHGMVARPVRILIL
jgi:hypothetical protein